LTSNNRRPVQGLTVTRHCDIVNSLEARIINNKCVFFLNSKMSGAKPKSQKPYFSVVYLINLKVLRQSNCQVSGIKNKDMNFYSKDDGCILEL